MPPPDTPAPAAPASGPASASGPTHALGRAQAPDHAPASSPAPVSGPAQASSPSPASSPAPTSGPASPPEPASASRAASTPGPASTPGSASAPGPASAPAAAPAAPDPGRDAPDLPAIPAPARSLPADPDPWATLRPLTPARIGLARSGAAIATRPLLEFRLAHARARDAVHAPLDAALADALSTPDRPALVVHSRAPDRAAYLRRPDLGRDLDDAAGAILRPHATGWDLAVVVVDGLSARAAGQAPALLARLLPALQAQGWRVAPPVLVQQGRVASGDAVAAGLRAAAACVLIGERPGLSAPESLGAYLTWAPGPATTDADRNCVSNIQPHGLREAEAAHRILHLLTAMRAGQRSGVALKDLSGQPPDLAPPEQPARQIP